ncbi:MAG TPA: Si-specific NAD(P)(+) transhydrogenase [Polyangia bacterium]
MDFDVVVIGSGPAGQKAAIQAAKAKARVAIIEQEPGVGGMCVHYGTIPSKTLRETAVQLARARRHSEMAGFRLREGVEVSALMSRLHEVIDAHVGYIGRQIDRNGIAHIHGRARFVSSTCVDVQNVRGEVITLNPKYTIIATGSRPRNPPEIPVDHENILDSDSILSMIYLPASITVLGAGVIATEYAAMFAHLGVQVTMIEKTDRPLKFMDGELVGRFLEAFKKSGGRFIGGVSVNNVSFDGVSRVTTELSNGERIETDKLMVALGRSANLETLNIGAAGLVANKRGLLEVDQHLRTSVANIYAVGDVIGPPALAATAMAQGARAARHALGLTPGRVSETIPVGIYSIPEMACVGMSEEEAQKACGAAPVIGRARFEEVARGQISNILDGLLKIVADPTGTKILGVHIVGEGASDLIHVGQMAMLGGITVDELLETTFNFPTLGEAYRVAAYDLIERRGS